MLKHVTLRRVEVGGQVSWKLLSPDGTRMAAFDIFATSLLRSNSPNTRESYCRFIAYFLDYLLEAAEVFAKAGSLMTRTDFQAAIEAYDDYLVLGAASGKTMAVTINANLPSRHNSATTSALAHAAIRQFLKLSEKARSEVLDLEKVKLIDAGQVVIDSHELFEGINSRVKLGLAQRQALVTKSVLAGVVAGGAKQINGTLLRTPTCLRAPRWPRAFPFDKILPFLRKFDLHRDRAMYSLIAGTGCRIHEAVQVLFEDIDANQMAVRLVDPTARRNHPSYLYLTPIEREKLCWKGRTDADTFFIEPFASIFFEELEQYLRFEYIAHGAHNFVFQDVSASIPGKPYLLVDASTRRKVFKAAAITAGIEENVEGPHSLRHAYGIYNLNYFPKTNGEYGLPLQVVQQLMGHAHVRSTAIYARHDKDLLKQELAYANALVYSGVIPVSALELKLNALNAAAAKLESEIIALKALV
ncbi:tyrosine-type recombinase/integrase [Paraburkholderia nemoris]|uniref:tyrosine-type recombinase/integrase n=1 Tax=Paraburkholderia nemoris TaxID=2793076 RepID=UPI0038B6B871